MEVFPKIVKECPSTHPCIPAVPVWTLSHIPVILVQAVQKGYLLPRLPLPLLSLFASHSLVLLTKEICLLEGPQLPEFPWQQPPWRSLLLAKTLISESGCGCFSLEDLQTEEEGQKNWRRRKFTPGRGKRKKNELQREPHSGHKSGENLWNILGSGLCPHFICRFDHVSVIWTHP